MVDMLGVGLIGPLLMIEVSGRPYGRILALLISILIFLLAVVKFSIWDMFLDQRPEASPALRGVDCGDHECPSFNVMLPDSSPGDAPVLGRECSEVVYPRPFQSSFFILIMPAIGLPALLVIMIVACCSFRSFICGKLCGRGDEDEDDESESESEDEEDRRRKKKKRDRDTRRDKDRDRDRDKDRERRKKREKEKDEDRRTRRNKEETSESKKKKTSRPRAASEEVEINVGDHEPSVKPPPPSHGKPPPPSGKPPAEKGLRGPKVPGKAKLGFKAKGGGGGGAAATTAVAEASYPSAVPEPPSAPPPPIEWFYMDLDNVQQGPTSDDGLRQLYNMGDIHDFTFVWHEALPAWAPLKDQGVVQGLPEASMSVTPVYTSAHV